MSMEFKYIDIISRCKQVSRQCCPLLIGCSPLYNEPKGENAETLVLIGFPFAITSGRTRRWTGEARPLEHRIGVRLLGVELSERGSCHLTDRNEGPQTGELTRLMVAVRRGTIG